MQVPSILQGDSLKRLLQGAAAGAVATMFVGFVWGGWSLRSTADKIAKDHSELAVIAALAPVCADRFRALPDADARKAALSKVDSWKRQDEFPKEFVTLPGETYPSSTLVDACYTLFGWTKVSRTQMREQPGGTSWIVSSELAGAASGHAVTRRQEGLWPQYRKVRYSDRATASASDDAAVASHGRKSSCLCNID